MHYRVSSDRGNWHFASKLNDPGKNLDIARNFESLFSYIVFEKVKLQSLFFPRKKQNSFFLLSTIYKIYLQNCISWGGGSK